MWKLRRNETWADGRTTASALSNRFLQSYGILFWQIKQCCHFKSLCFVELKSSFEYRKTDSWAVKLLNNNLIPKNQKSKQDIVSILNISPSKMINRFYQNGATEVYFARTFHGNVTQAKKISIGFYCNSWIKLIKFNDYFAYV